MRKVYTVFFFLFFIAGANAQVGLTATAGTLTGTYTTLKGAFDAINLGTHRGVITINITGNTTETATAQLRNSGYLGLSSYTSVSIQPAGGSAITVGGSLNNELVDFYGAANVTIDGLNSGGNSLTISNTNTGTGANTVRYSGMAANNTIRNCTVLGSTTGTQNANILFSSFTAAGITTGVTNITVDNCNIGDAASNTPHFGIYAEGTTSLINAGITITNCNIYNYFHPAASFTSGIRVTGANTNWTISNNKFYQTSTRTFTAGVEYSGIAISQASTPGTNFTISNNIIGFNSSSSTQGTTTDLTGSANGVRGIYFKAGTSAASSIQNNTIAGFSQLTTKQATTVATTGFIGIMIEGGNVIVNNNTIGNSSANSITVTAAPAAAGTYAPQIGIYLNSVDATTISNNNLGGFIINASTAQGQGIGFNGIRVTQSALATISGNTVGGTPANSIFVNTTSGKVIGIYLESGTATATTNKISGLSSPASITGIGVYGAASSVSNNFISLGSAITSNAVIAGIEHSSGTSPVFYYNSVRIQGTVSAGANTTAGLIVGNSLSFTAKNNIFYNERTGGTGTHYAVQIGSAVTITSNNNDLYVSGPQLGNINGTNYAALANWRTGSGQDANSISSVITFVGPTDLHITDATSITAIHNKGTSIGSITTDYDSELRGSCVDIGADEVTFSSAGPSYVWLGSIDTRWCEPCNWNKDAVPASANDVVISSAGNYPVLNTAAACATAECKDITITGGTSITIQTGGALNVYGNFSNAGTYTHTGGDISFRGSFAQTVTSSGNLSFYNLIMNGSGGVNMNANATVTNQLTLTNGLINVNAANTFAFASTGTYTGGNNNSYVNGVMRQLLATGALTFTLPVGKGGHFGPIGATVVAGTAANGDYFDGEYFASSSGNNGSVNANGHSPAFVYSSYVEYWNLNKNSGSGAQAYVTLYFPDPAYSQIFDKGRDILRVVKNISGVWTDQYNDNTNDFDPIPPATNYFITSFDLQTTFGRYTFGTAGPLAAPLPLRLKLFTATKQSGFNKLNWEVHCFTRQLTFETQRSADGRNFQTINSFTASQDRCNQPFDYKDYAAIGEKILYYRIKMTDEYGRVQYTQVAVIINKAKGFDFTGLFPNPAADRIMVNLSSAIKENVLLTITDVNGKLSAMQKLQISNGSALAIFNIGGFAKGTYTITVFHSNGEREAKCFIKK